jgi:hypothetical protein
LLILGANPVSNRSLMTAPDCKRRLRSYANGGRLVIVDRAHRDSEARRRTRHSSGWRCLPAARHAAPSSPNGSPPGRLAPFRNRRIEQRVAAYAAACRDGLRDQRR